MKTKSSYCIGLAVILSCTLALSMETPAAPDAAARAGEVSRLIPAVSITRGAKTINASTKSEVMWQDTINTQASARVRVGLDDGSVLNVGSDSTMKVVKHDAAAQQTELELTVGRLRAQAQKIAKPDGKFEVHTPAGVAGVVGTDVYVEYENNLMNVIVFEGFVRVCNLAGQCVILKAGQMTTVRSGDNAAPPPPQQATLSLLTSATTDTNVGGGPGATTAGLTAAGAHSIGTLSWVLIAVITAAAVGIPVGVAHGRGTSKQPAPPQNPCQADPYLPQCG